MGLKNFAEVATLKSVFLPQQNPKKMRKIQEAQRKWGSSSVHGEGLEEKWKIHRDGVMVENHYQQYPVPLP